MQMHLVVKTLYVVSGFFYSASPEWGLHTNATGTKMKLHEFKHPFFEACLRYLAQLFCCAVYLIAFGRRTEIHRVPPGNRGADDRQRQQDGHRVHGGGGQQQPQGDRGVNDAAAGHGQQRRARPFNQNFPPEHRDTTKYKKIIFLPCTLCDMARTGLLYVGIRLTYPSSFIMLNGIVTFFTALLSVAFLATPLQNRMWFGVCVNVCGLALIGLRDYIHNEKYHSYDPYGIAAGDLLIVMAMIMTATKVILEEKFVKKHNISPLLAVGLEGLFGFFISIFLMIIFYMIDVGAFSILPEHRLEDCIDAFQQLKNSWQVAMSLIGTIVSVCLYFYFGITIAKTQDHGAVSRMVLDNIASLLFFALLLGVGWQDFNLQLMPGGYVLVILGVMIYYDIFFYGMYRRIRCCLGCPDLVLPGPPGGETEPLVNVNNQNGYGSIQEENDACEPHGACQRGKPI